MWGYVRENYAHEWENEEKIIKNVSPFVFFFFSIGMRTLGNFSLMWSWRATPAVELNVKPVIHVLVLGMESRVGG